MQFETAMAEAKETNGGESKGEIAKYKALKKRALGGGGEQPLGRIARTLTLTLTLTLTTFSGYP